MPKARQLMRVSKIEYTPRSKDKDAFSKPLTVHIHGVVKSGKRIELKVLGCLPRIWVDKDPKDVFIPPEVKHYIVGVEKSGKAFIDGRDLWCIYVKYPYGKIIHALRDCFGYTCQADVPFTEAVRFFYGIESYISFPKGKHDINIEDITPEKTQIPEFQLNHYIFDIETSDAGGFPDAKYPTAPIRCMTLLGVNDGDIHCCITTDVKEKDIQLSLKDKEFLEEAINHTEEIEPLRKSTQIDVTVCNDGDKERNEIDMLIWLRDMINKLGINTILTYNDYDVPYIVERTKICNKKIAAWNAKNDGNRWYYPRHMFRPTNVADLEEFYQRIISGSAKASGRTALEWMGQEEVGYGKIKRDAIDKMYHEYPELLCIYNIWDCVLPDRVMKKCGELVEVHQGVCDYMGTSLENWKMPMMQWEAKLMHVLNPDEILPSINSVVRDDGMEAGGFVSDTAPTGLFENMVELDNSGEYNAVVLTGNIDHRTLVKEGDDLTDRRVSTFPSGRQYYLDVKGVIPEILKEMIESINSYKRQIKEVQAQIDEMYKNSADKPGKSPMISLLEDQLEKLEQLKYVPKSGTLSSTGLYGTSSLLKKNGTERKRPFRCAHGGMGSDVTECGRIHEHWNKDFIESHYYNHKTGELFDSSTIEFDSISLIRLLVLYQDTDSCKCSLEGNLPELNNDMAKFLQTLGDVYCKGLNASFDEFALKTLDVTEHYFMIKLDATYKKYFQWGANKNYVYKDFNNKIKYKGVRLVKRGTPIIIQKFMREFFEIVMDDITREEVITNVSSLMNEYETDILSGHYIKECGEPRGVHTESLYYESMVFSNSAFDKEFKLGDVAIFYPTRTLKGHSLPKNRQIALEYGDDPNEFGISLDFEKVFTKLKESMIKILKGLEVDATWESICDGIQTGDLDGDDMW